MRRGTAIAVCAALAACVPEPTFRGVRVDAAVDAAEPDAAADPCANDVVITRSGTMNRGATVCGPGYEVVFSDSGARMPYQLNVGGAQLLGVGQSCNDERGMGVALFPAALVNGENQSPATVDGSITTRLMGPVIGQLVVDWSAAYNCSAAGTLQDRSTFTFFPDGHITRFDTLRHVAQVMPTGCGVCSGGGNGNFFLTSYTTLVAPPGSTLTGASIDGLVNYADVVPNLRNPCLTTLGRRVAFGFRISSPTRVRVASASPRAIAFVQDVLAGATAIGPNLEDDVTTHVLVSSTTACADLSTRALVLADRPSLMVQDVNAGPALDGIYGGENDAGSTAIQTVVGDIELKLPASPTSNVPGGYAVWIEFGAQPNTNVQVLHNNIPSAPSGVWYRTQRVSASQLIFWFRDELVPGTIITIRPG